MVARIGRRWALAQSWPEDHAVVATGPEPVRHHVDSLPRSPGSGSPASASDLPVSEPFVYTPGPGSVLPRERPDHAVLGE